MKYNGRKFNDKICGIYSITTPTGKCYIGSSVHIQCRWSEHRYGLRHKKHHSVRLQNAFNKYGDLLKFNVLEECDRSNLNIREQYYIDNLDSQLNTSTFVANLWVDYVYRAKMKIVQSSPEYKKKMSEAGKNAKACTFREIERSDGYIFRNLTDAARSIGVKASGMMYRCENQNIDKEGLRFKYKTDDWLPFSTFSEKSKATREKNGTLFHSETALANIRAAKVGYRFSRKAIDAATVVRQVPVVGLNIESGAMVEYISVRIAASHHHGISTRTAEAQISKCLHGVKKNAYGYKWRIKTDANP